MLSEAKIKSKSKGDYNSSFLNIHNDNTKKTRKVLANSIPVLSIFAFLGIMGYTLGIGVLDNNTEVAYAAEEVIGDSTASITIGGSGSNEQVEAGYNTVTYRTHNVRVQASNINSYTLNLSGSSTLVTRNKDGSSITNGNTTTIKSANGATGAVMASNTTSTYDNTWGYGYSTNTSISNEDITYTAPVASSNGGTNLNIGGNSIIDTNTHNLDSTIKLAFAIKFGDSAIPGRYYDSVVLSLVVTPRVLTTYSITYNGNGNTGGSVPTKQEASVYDTTSYTFTAASNTGNLTKTGYNFLGWNESSNATTATYKVGDKVTLASTKPAITLYAVWELKKTTYTLTLNTNGGSGGPGSQSCTATGTATSCTITISSTKPTRSGYTFLGWNTNSSGTGTTYNAGGSITLSSNTTLYAKWQQDITWSTMTTMQQMTPAICAGASVGASKTLTDTRDNSTYMVKKLNNEQCWMTQNLRLTKESLTANKHSTSIDSSDSDMTSGSFTIPASSTSGFSSDAASNAYYPNDTTKGAYYTWCAATAGSCSSATTAGANATNSICPKGWKLPAGTPGTGTNDFAKAIGLASKNIADSTNYWSSLSSPSFASNALTVNGITWPAAGYYISSSAGYVGTDGIYWSRTANSSANAYYFNFSSGYAYPANYYSRRYGYSVRCVAYSS